MNSGMKVVEEFGYHKLNIRMFRVYYGTLEFGYVKLNKDSGNLSFKANKEFAESKYIRRALDMVKDILVEEELLK